MVKNPTRLTTTAEKCLEKLVIEKLSSPLGINLDSVRVLGLGTRLDFAPVLGRVIVPVTKYGRKHHTVGQMEEPKNK